ncbi:MAG: 6,7-dimethyl-8-ribityllumazine synthase [candidate division WOR-3 bacterium]|nr:6,7-dimethyl-8-ribityllumazine synthase [candidate division WOR-3 bacterium]
MKYRVIEGNLDGKGKKIGIIISRFNNFISRNLLDGAVDCLVRHNIKEDDISVYYVPGAFEIPQTAGKLASAGKLDGIICLGAVIRGETPHFEYVSSEVSKGIAKVSLETDIPVGFGIITADSTDQAIERAGTKSGNKGYSAAEAVLEMMDLFTKMDS